MACAICNSTADQVRLAKLAITGSWTDADTDVNCTMDGSFVINATRWPAPYHFLDDGVARFLLETVGSDSLLDIGAGSGQYGAWFESQRSLHWRMPIWRGVDGASNIEEYTRTRGPPGSFVQHASVCDATLRLPPADWAMALEVGEHLPSQCVPTFTELLARSARHGILLSWARPGQGGVCHISTRDVRWVRATFEGLGWAVDEQRTEQARAAAKLSWLRKNLLVLRPFHDLVEVIGGSRGPRSGGAAMGLVYGR